MNPKKKKHTILIEKKINCDEKFCDCCEFVMCEGPVYQPSIYKSICCLLDKKLKYNKKADDFRRHKLCIEGEITDKVTWTKK